MVTKKALEKYLKRCYYLLMATQQAQIKLNLPIQLRDYLASRAGRFGMPVAGYVKHLILKDVEILDYPVFKASKRTEQAYKKAKQEEKKGKLIKVSNIDKFFDNL
jgi:hypothetical protein